MPGSVRPVKDEREGLLAYLAHQRHMLGVAAFGLAPEQLRATPTPSALSMGGLVKHVTVTERSWMDDVAQRTRDGAGPEEYARSFTLTPDDTLESLLADLAAAARETEEIVAGIEDLGRPVPVQPAPWFPPEVEAWSVRWVLLHLIEETARHAGHADIIREAVDGATAIPLLAAVEGWPETEWVRPWRPT